MTEDLTAGVRFKFFRRDRTIVLDLVDNHAWVPTSESRRTQELANEVQELKVEHARKSKCNCSWCEKTFHRPLHHGKVAIARRGKK